MSWENFGQVSESDDTWNVDHIIPLISAKDSNEVKKLTHYTNLQPMWAMDNIMKGANYDGLRYGGKPGPKPKK